MLPLISLFLHFPLISSLCDPSLLANCDACCSLLFPSDDCSLREVFRVKVNGNGALGAIWDNSVTSVIVKPGCLLDMWDVRNQTGSHRAFGLDGRVYFPLEWYAFERKASSLRCTCVTTPPPTSTEDPLTQFGEVAHDVREEFLQRSLKEEEQGALVNITEKYYSNSTER